MQINNLDIIQADPILKPTDTIDAALATLAIAQQPALPVVDAQGALQGVATLDELLQHKKTAKLTQIIIEKPDVYLSNQSTLHAALQIFNAENMSVLPLIDENNKFVGYITLQNLAQYFSRYFNNTASVVVLECAVGKYSAAEIARLAEANNCQILSLNATPLGSNADLLHITLHVAQADLTALIATYERFDYEVIYKQHQTIVPDLYQERYDALMHYLAI